MGQNNLIRKKIALSDTIFLDSSWISALHIDGIDSSHYFWDKSNNKLWWKQKPNRDSVSLQYRKTGLNLYHTFQHKSRKSIDSVYLFSAQQIGANTKKGTSDFVQYDQLERSGSYGRSFSFGNNQDVVSNSNFNLQLNGYLMDSIKIEAALTDNTVPFQPEGNTSNLQEFDLINIKLSKKRSQLQLGDYNLLKPDAYFLNYTKRVQGAFFQTTTQFSPTNFNKMGISASIAKGEFARNIFMGTEGNQGPYRLVGNNGEQLFVILATTEKVYVDNVLQERGENADYIINYNTNEIKFMPRRPINQYSRIQVTFEYKTNNYLNSLIAAYDEWQFHPKWKLKANFYANQDAKNQAYQQNLNPSQKRLLESIGDSIHLALVNNFSRDSFSSSKILYRIKDTVYLGQHYDSVCEYSSNPNEALYTVSFSYVGPFKGDYKVASNLANGRSYMWVGKNQGDYTALSLIITPKAQQLLSLATEYQIDSFKKLNVELAASNKNPNTFSTKDIDQHQGLASKIIYEERRFLGASNDQKPKQWLWDNYMQYEYVQAQFKAIAPFRVVEFGRDWNVPMEGNSPNENWLSIRSSIQNQQWGKWSYEWSHYQRDLLYKGMRHSAAYLYDLKNWKLGLQASNMQAEDTGTKTLFFKPKVELEYRLISKIQTAIGASYYAEHNAARKLTNDSFQSTAFNFDIRSFYLKTLKEKSLSYQFQFFQRRDWLPQTSDWQFHSLSDNYNLQLNYSGLKNHRILFTGSYRTLHYQNTAALTLPTEQTLIGRLQYDGSFCNRALSISSLYDFGTGQEQKKTFTYLKVPSGQGVYDWVDYNQDSVQQLNEFVVALYPDQKNYIRIFTPSDAYVKVNTVQLNQSILFEPAHFFKTKNKNTLQKGIALFSNQFAYQVNNKILSTEGLGTYNPFNIQYQDTSILMHSLNINNSAYLNRSSAQWGLDYNILENKNKQLLSYGPTLNGNRQQILKYRMALNKRFNTNLTALKGARYNRSGTNDGNNYDIKIWALEPALIWQYQSKFRFSLAAKQEERSNSLGSEFAQLQSLIFDSRISHSSIGVFQLKFTFSKIRYNASEAAPIAYAMLDALKKGDNFLWFVNWQRQLGKGIEIFLEYEGRKAGADGLIHTGRMSLRAIL